MMDKDKKAEKEDIKSLRKNSKYASKLKFKFYSNLRYILLYFRVLKTYVTDYKILYSFK